MGSIRLRIWLLVILVVIIAAIQLVLDNSQAAVEFYIRHVFLPLQRGRSNLLNPVSISIGDIVYLLLSLLLLLLLIRVVYFTITYRRNKIDFWVELLRFFTLPLVIYLAFLLLWGGNYSRKPLANDWKIWYSNWDTARLVRLNSFLIDRLNQLQEQPLHYPDLAALNQISNAYYHERFGDYLPQFKVKPTSLGYMLNYLGVHGYYNPLSGESQYNRFIPDFMQPFVVTHEMAHQAGVAREDDANLLAYLIGVQSPLPAYRYSAYFNVFLYSYADLRALDSEKAAELLQHLNADSRSDMATLKEISKKYSSIFRGFSNALYDEYLRLHGQRKGLDAYNYVTHWVYYWEFVSKEQAGVSLLE